MKLQTSMVVKCPQEAVFECVSSFAFIQEWVAPIRTARYGISFDNHPHVVHHGQRITELYQMTEEPVTVGTIFKQGSGRVGSFLESTIEVIGYEDPNVLTFQITSNLAVARTKYIVEQAIDGTRLTMLADIQFRGIWMNLIGLLSIFLNRNAPEKYSIDVKQYIEEHC